MHYSNLISTTIPPKVNNEIIEHIHSIDELLPDLLNLSKEELTSFPKVSFGNIDFVHEALEYTQNYPELIPEDIDVDEIKKDLELTESIMNILRPLRKLVKKLERNALVAGSEAYVPSMAIYNAVKTNTKTRKKTMALS